MVEPNARALQHFEAVAESLADRPSPDSAVNRHDPAVSPNTKSEGERARSSLLSFVRHASRRGDCVARLPLRSAKLPRTPSSPPVRRSVVSVYDTAVAYLMSVSSRPPSAHDSIEIRSLGDRDGSPTHTRRRVPALAQGVFARVRSSTVGQTFVIDAIGRCGGIIAGIVAARSLGPAGRGDLAALMVWVAPACALFSTGYEQAIIHEVGRQPKRATRVFTDLRRPLASQIGAAMMLTALAGPLVLGSDRWHLIPGLLVVVSSFIPLFILNWSLAVDRARERHTQAAAWAAGIPWVYASAAALAGHSSVLDFAVAYAIACAGILVLNLARTWRRPPSGPAPIAREGDPLPMLAARFRRAQVPTVLIVNLDVLLVASMLSSASAGHHAIALAVAMAPIGFCDAQAKIAHARLCAANSDAARRSALGHQARVVIVAVALVTPATLLLAPVLIELAFGAEFLVAIAAVRWWIVARCLLAASLALDLGLRALGETRQTWRIHATAGLGLLLAVLVGHHLGTVQIDLLTMARMATIAQGLGFAGMLATVWRESGGTGVRV